jgi:hypothetical protein
MKMLTACLLSSVAALSTLNAAQAAPTANPAEPAQSYADLLEPVGNASALLLADDLFQRQQPKPLLQLARHHHHHHHSYHHHHHHHHRGYGPGFGIVVGPPAYQDCYWTEGRPYWNGWRWVHPRVRVCD